MAKYTTSFNENKGVKECTKSEDRGKSNNIQKELNKPWAYSRFNDSLNFVIRAIRQIRKGPAGIC